MPIYRGVGGVNREIKNIYRGVGGVNREITQVYKGVGGTNRFVYGTTAPVVGVTIDDLAVGSLVETNYRGKPLLWIKVSGDSRFFLDKTLDQYQLVPDYITEPYVEINEMILEGIPELQRIGEPYTIENTWHYTKQNGEHSSGVYALTTKVSLYHSQDFRSIGDVAGMYPCNDNYLTAEGFLKQFSWIADTFYQSIYDGNGAYSSENDIIEQDMIRSAAIRPVCTLNPNLVVSGPISSGGKTFYRIIE